CAVRVLRARCSCALAAHSAGACYLQPLNLLHLFDLSLTARRDQPALEFAGNTYTFGDIEARSNRLAQLLTRRGLKTGDRLCIYLANCVEMIDLYLACAKVGVIFVPITFFIASANWPISSPTPIPWPLWLPRRSLVPFPFGILPI